MENDILSQAVINNAEWCNTVLDAHGFPGRFEKDAWIQDGITLPFYPNIITLTKNVKINEKTVNSLNTNLGNTWSIKDSYASLRLEEYEFKELFSAQWIYVNKQKVEKLPAYDSPIEWKRITTKQDLESWEKAWSGTSPIKKRFFLPALLTNENIAIVGGFENGNIIAGGIGNKTKNIVGISNIFTSKDYAVDICWKGVISTLSTIFPSVDFVGYESGESLNSAKLVGFEEIGKLRVWIK